MCEKFMLNDLDDLKMSKDLKIDMITKYSYLLKEAYSYFMKKYFA